MSCVFIAAMKPTNSESMVLFCIMYALIATLYRRGLVVLDLASRAISMGRTPLPPRGMHF